MLHTVPANSPPAWPPAAGGLRMQRSDRSPTASPWVCDVLGHESARDGTCFVPLEQTRGAVVVSVVVAHDSGDETDADPETAQQHRGGDHRPPRVARTGGEQRQR